MNEDVKNLMEEQPGGENFGRKGGGASGMETDETAKRTQRSRPLDSASLQVENEMYGHEGEGEAGFSFVGPGIPFSDGGVVAHRGVLHPDEYIDKVALRAVAEESLGFTFAEIQSAYTKGRPTTEQRQLRERIDSRLLALSRSGGAMATLSAVLELSEKTVDRALARARMIEVAPIVTNPAVRSRTVCFTCEAEGARPRRRRHSTSPEQWVGTVDLCDKCYARGFETRPGNPRYWESRLATRPVGV